MPLFSVIINNYNYARFLPQAIDSVLEQTFTDYEIIVVDDASTDHSLEVITAYGNKIIPIFQEINSGQGAAFNAGFAQSRGELVAFLDADDAFLPEKLSQIAAYAHQYAEGILYFHQCYSTDIDLIPEHNTPFPLHLKGGNLLKFTRKTSHTLLPPTSYLVFRRTFLQQVLPLTPYLTRHGAEYPLQILASLMGPVIAVPLPLGLYRKHGDNWFSNGDLKYRDGKTLHRLMRRYEKNIFYINSKLSELGIKDNLDCKKNSDYCRALFIFGKLGWVEYVISGLLKSHVGNWLARWEHFRFGVRQRRLQEMGE